MPASVPIPTVLDPSEPVTRLQGVGPVAAARLAVAGIRTLRELLLWFPRRVRELEPLDAPRADAIGRWVRLTGHVLGSSLRWLPGRRSLVLVQFGMRDGAVVEVGLWNQPYLKNAFAAGSPRVAEGQLERRRSRWSLRQARILGAGATVSGVCQLQYAAIDGISAARLAALVHKALSVVDLRAWREPSPPPGLGLAFDELGSALRAMHLPQSAAEHDSARQRFAVLEAVALFRRVEAHRRARANRQGLTVRIGPELEARLATVIPFAWTKDQAAAVAAIRARLAGPSPMGLLLQGDVGTGKTAVALWATLAVVAAGHQVALLAPTELLAEQHFEVWSSWLAGRRVQLRLLTASLAAAERQQTLDDLRTGRAALVVGTHALLAEATAFASLGLVIVDEQHRFGVAQRMELVRKGADPHVLVMTATPIPRTLALTRLGDLDCVALVGRPQARRSVRTVFVAPKAWPRVLRAIARRVRRNQQVYVVCARVGEDGSKGGAVLVHQQLGRHVKCGLVHGRLAAAERRAATAAFRAGQVKVLVGTTVLEVGVDVPEATLMVIIGAERYGLATLHQLRGRVGRGRQRGLCIVTGERTERVDALCQCDDGFVLAEQDLRLRGAGELLGTQQSGLGDFRALDPVEDGDLLQRVREAVRKEGDGSG